VCVCALCVCVSECAYAKGVDGDRTFEVLIV